MKYRSVTLGILLSVIIFAAACGNKGKIVLEFLKSSPESKSCILLDEGCGISEALFAPKLDPDCGKKSAGEEVKIRGTFAAQLNLLSKTYIPWPVDSWEPAASTQYAYVVIEPDPEAPDSRVLIHRRYCEYSNTKVKGSQTVYYYDMFKKLATFHYSAAVSDAATWRIGDNLTIIDGWTKWGLTKDFDPLTMNVPTDASSRYQLDEDEDGHPGVTITVQSELMAAASGDYYIAQSATFDEEMKICTADHLQGYRVKAPPTDQVTFEATSLVGASSLNIINKPGSTIIYIKIDESTEMPDQDEICEFIIAGKGELFSGGATAPTEEEPEE